MRTALAVGFAAGLALSAAAAVAAEGSSLRGLKPPACNRREASQPARRVDGQRSRFWRARAVRWRTNSREPASGDRTVRSPISTVPAARAEHLQPGRHARQCAVRSAAALYAFQSDQSNAARRLGPRPGRASERIQLHQHESACPSRPSTRGAIFAAAIRFTRAGRTAATSAPRIVSR